MDGLLAQALSCEILAEHTHRECVTCQVPFPVLVVLNWVAIDSFVLASMHGKIRLPVAIQIECSQGNAALDMLFID
jgi:hypothetical protein